MEFVKVTYYRRRTVYIDGDESGFTNTLLRVNRGTHKFELSAPDNYTPTFRTPFVKDTIPALPMIIEFEPKR
jgi:hypothetical protein